MTIFRQIFEYLVTLWIIISLLFFLLRSLPGGPFDDELPLSAADISRLDAFYGLNESLIRQYFLFLKNLFTGSLGESMVEHGKSVSEIIWTSLPVSLEIALPALLLAVIIGVSFGLLSVIYRGRFFDLLLRGGVFVGLSLPSFAIASLLIFFFSFYLDLLPVALWEETSHKILPILVLSIRPISIIIRVTRTTALQQSRKFYILVARAKGLSPIKIARHHILKNCLIPVITILSPISASLLTGSFVVESMFGIPGIGRFLIESIAARDYSVALSLCLLYSFLLVSANFLAEIGYRLVDPRIGDNNLTVEG